MLRAVKIRLYPNNEQATMINKLLGCYRVVYNQCLARKIKSYEETKTFNPIMVPTKCGGLVYDSTCKNIKESGESGRTHKTFKINAEKVHGNIFEIAVAQNKSAHPAVFPLKLAEIHISTWNNEGDLVLDPFIGSGTTAKVAKELKRNYIGFDVSEEYCKIAEERIRQISVE